MWGIINANLAKKHCIIKTLYSKLDYEYESYGGVAYTIQYACNKTNDPI